MQHLYVISMCILHIYCLEQVEILGPAASGAPTELRVRFRDGTIDDWDVEDFLEHKAEAKWKPGQLVDSASKPIPSILSLHLSPPLPLLPLLPLTFLGVLHAAVVVRLFLPSCDKSFLRPVETDDGWERGVTVLGPADSGNADEMRVRFPDGTVDDWDVDELVESKKVPQEARQPPKDLVKLVVSSSACSNAW